MKYNRSIIAFIFIIIIFLSSFFISKSRNNSETASPSEQPTEKLSTSISTIVVPHHDLDKEDRGALFSQIKDDTLAKTIIVVSTNHFEAGSSNILTTDKEWSLSKGKILPNLEVIRAIVGSEIALNDENVFSDEHGIKNILPDVLEYFPGANVVPIILKQGTREEDIEKLNRKLIDSCSNNCLFVGSVDFSHYQPGALAQIHDDLSIRTLTNLDTELLKRAEVDSKETLLLAMKWAKANESEQFNLFKNTNSGKIENNRDGESTSYVLGWYQKGKVAKKADSFTFMIGGDMMFDRGIEYRFQGDNLVDVMKNFGNRVFSGIDLSITNLEGPISPTSLVPQNDESMVFNFQPNTTGVLSWLGINAVSLANNHTLNNGKAGLANTKKVLSTSGISYVGQDALFNDESIKTFSNGGNIKLTVMSIDCLNTPTDFRDEIKHQKALGNLVLIYPHWGTEYELVHSKSQEVLAHSWIDAGADFIFGGHPHVIQDAEVYKGRPIFYSLGNLLFDQSFSPETQRGLVVAVKINKEDTELVLLPTISKKHQPELMTGNEKTSFLKRFREYLGAPEVDQNYGYDIINIGAE